MNLKLLFASLLSCLILISCKTDATPEPSLKEYKDISYEAFVYTYPILEQVRLVNSLLSEELLEQNRISILKGFGSESKSTNEILTGLLPNTAGTLIDVTNGPVIIDIPKTRDRYSVIQCVDMFTHNIFYLGTRANFGFGGRFVFYTKGQALPNDQSIQAILLEGNYAIMLMGYLEDKKGAMESLKEIVEDTKIIYKPNEISAYPVYDKKRTTSADFVTYLNELIDSIPRSEQSMFDKFRILGVKDSVQLGSEQRLAIQQGIDSAMVTIKTSAEDMEIGNGYRSSLGYFGNRRDFKGAYLKRAVGAYAQLWSDSSIESVWYATEANVKGKIRFKEEELPPLTEKGGMEVSIRDSNGGLFYAVYLNQKELQGRKILDLNFSPQKSSGTWIKTPEEEYTIYLRFYLPKAENLESYVPPPFEETSN